MKRIIFALVWALIGTNGLMAQNQQRDLYFQQMISLENLTREMVHAGHLEEAIATLTDVITMIDTTSASTLAACELTPAALKNQKAMTQYDMACYYALLGQKKQALAALEQSVTNGYDNYLHIIYDDDLKSLRKDKKYQQLLQKIKGQTKIEVLRRSSAYDYADQTELPQFQYQAQDDPNLQRVRDYFRLDTISGQDDELTHIKNLLHFVHDHIRHDGGNLTICEFDAIDIYNYHRSTGRGVNCRQLAISLCEVYLSVGYKARVVTCMPADPNDFDCHVINTVYSETLQKWLYVDPTMDAWVMDEQGTMLSIAEVRERLIHDQPLVLCPTANWNHENQQSKEYYLETYMAKNLYYFHCNSRSCFNPESIYRDTQNEDVCLIPAGFENNHFRCASTSNPDAFWEIR